VTSLWLFTSVPDPQRWDPYVSGSSGSGKQRYGWNLDPDQNVTDPQHCCEVVVTELYLDSYDLGLVVVLTSLWRSYRRPRSRIQFPSTTSRTLSSSTLAGTKVGKYPIGKAHFVTAIVTGNYSTGIWRTGIRWKMNCFGRREIFNFTHRSSELIVWGWRLARNGSLLLCTFEIRSNYIL
jgi:hypothetical protein